MDIQKNKNNWKVHNEEVKDKNDNQLSNDQYNKVSIKNKIMLLILRWRWRCYEMLERFELWNNPWNYFFSVQKNSKIEMKKQNQKSKNEKILLRNKLMVEKIKDSVVESERKENKIKSWFIQRTCLCNAEMKINEKKKMKQKYPFWE